MTHSHINDYFPDAKTAADEMGWRLYDRAVTEVRVSPRLYAEVFASVHHLQRFTDPDKGEQNLIIGGVMYLIDGQAAPSAATQVPNL